MTYIAFILGVVPFGVAVFSGMLEVTLFGIFLTPVFFYLLGRLSPVPSTGSNYEPKENKYYPLVFLFTVDRIYVTGILSPNSGMPEHCQ